VDGALRDELSRELARLRASTPFEVLGVAAEASIAEVRASFLALTKRLHPNRFARRDPSILRLANEIFLLVRAAYEKARAPRVPSEVSRSIDMKPVSRRELAATAKVTPRDPPSQPPGRPRTASPSNPPSSAPAVGTVVPGAAPITGRTSGPSQPPGQPAATPGRARESSPPAAQPSGTTQPATPGRDPRDTRSSAQPPARDPGGSSPPPNSATTGRIDDELRAAIAEKRRQRLQASTAAAATAGGAGARESAPPAAAAPGERTARPSGRSASPSAEPRTSAAFAPPPQSREDRIRFATRQLEVGLLGEARVAFRALLAERPDDARVRALLHLCAARELATAGKPGDARAELERALVADPGLADAREMLAALDKKDGGLFSRWFRK
jgi:hypothetical protein